MKLQNRKSKIICYLVLIISSIAFLLSLGITTDIYNLYLVSSFGVEGSNIYEDIQFFNRVIVTLIVIGIVLSLSLFITRTHIRLRFYISNYISTVIVSIFNVVVSVIAIINLFYYREYFLNDVNFEDYKKWTEVFKTIKYTESTFWFDVNIIIYVLLILISLVLCINVFTNNKRRKVMYER